MNLGEAISMCRKQKGLTIDELVEKSGVPKGTLNKITNGITLSPKIETVRAIANALDMRMEDFERMCEKEKSPETTEVDSREEMKMLEELLVKFGYIQPGQDISDRDAAFLSHLIGLLNAWFEQSS